MIKRKLTVLIALMSFSLSGIIGIQLYWISTAIQVKEEQFDQQVYLALQQIVDKIETYDAVSHIQGKMKEAGLDSLQNFLESMAYINEDEKTESEQKIDSIKRQLKSRAGNISDLDSIKVLTISHLPQFITSHELELIHSKTEKLNDVLSRMVVEMARKEFSIQDRINLSAIDTIIKKELFNRGITSEVNYAIVTRENEMEVPFLRTLTFDFDRAEKAGYSINLFQNDVFSKPEFLWVYFEGKDNYVLGSIWFMLVLSVFFTGIIIFTFAHTFHVILKQKKIAEIKSDFINNMTHEFKTPIATISLASDSIANPKVLTDPEKIKYYTSIIRAENKRMNEHVENVLQMSLLEKQDFELSLQPLYINDIIHKACANISIQVEGKGGNIIPQLEDREVVIMGDEMHLTNVVFNLLDNANKYSPENPQITIKTKTLDDELLIRVSDNGIGMGKEQLKYIFDKFYRVHTGNLHNVKGFGLGLSYVKAIVTAHKGTIFVQSEPGKGSSFNIYLPINLQHHEKI